MIVQLRDRRFNATPLPAGITFVVEKYSHIAKGGPQEATIKATGDPDDLVQLLMMARYGVTIENDQGVAVWWGLIGRVTMPYGKVTLTVDLGEMYNRVAVAYTEVGQGQATTGMRGTTPWAQADDSAAEFGRRELLDSRGGTSLDHALISRDRTLAAKKYPLASAVIEPDQSGQKGEATITCWGWWETLNWLYAAVPVSLAFAYEATTGDYSIGQDDAADVIAYAQTITTGPTAWNLQSIGIPAGKTGTPPNGLKLAICANPDDLTPGEELASATINPADVVEGWNVASLSDALLLAANTSYFLVVSTTGVDAANWYHIHVDEAAGYAGGILRKKSGSTWSAATGDMAFRLYTNNIIETSQQIRSLLVNYGQFFRMVYVEVDSAIATESYRSGDSDAQAEIEELMDIGVSGGARLLSLVDPGRNCRVFAEPADAGNYFLSSDGHFYLNNDQVQDDTCPCGFWVRLRDVIPGGLDCSQLSGLDKFFVERAEYSVADKKLSYSLEDDPYNVGMTRG